MELTFDYESEFSWLIKYENTLYLGYSSDNIVNKY